MMRQLLAVLALAAAPSLYAQTTSRSATYLFTANVDDARAMWVNPAGLGILPLATMYAEFSADQGSGPTSDWSLRQYSLGLHSRNIGVTYKRDRFETGGSDGTWRVGAAFPLARRAAIGSAVTFTSPERQIMMGLRFSPVRLLDLGAVVENIGRPTVNGVKQPITAIAGFSWRLAGARLGIQADAFMSERPPLSGYDRRYRAGADLILPGRQSLSFLTAIDLENNLHVSRWSVGISIGFQAQAVAVGTALPNQGTSARLQAFSLTGVARGKMRSGR